uniref:VWFA domain-containing protein n=1 Tax=Physcomitrium patens TaxID=3218 RepID=A9RT92_PHYPA|nr:hypothetical protein PHYPA_025715 [Physcomitrium patens]PNR31595.1 hypothetical protein PHYPA_025716 [Physcomitrium patens]
MSFNNSRTLNHRRNNHDAVPRGLLTPSVFTSSFTAEGCSSDGNQVVAKYSMHEPTEENAHVHMLLDASGSTTEAVKKGDGRQVWEHLFENFGKVVKSKDTGFRPHDKICVWSFNRQTKPLCEVLHEDFASKEDGIKAMYKKQINEGTDYLETRLYDAVATVTEKIREEHEKHKKADFFLVVFTDGMDNVSEKVTLQDMMIGIQRINGRLHTCFITANMKPDTDLHKQLNDGKIEIVLIKIEDTALNSIVEAFNTFRSYIKVTLEVFMKRGNNMTMTRIAHYGPDRTSVAEDMARLLSEGMHTSSLTDVWCSLDSLRLT